MTTASRPLRMDDLEVGTFVVLEGVHTIQYNQLGERMEIFDKGMSGTIYRVERIAMPFAVLTQILNKEELKSVDFFGHTVVGMLPRHAVDLRSACLRIVDEDFAMAAKPWCKLWHKEETEEVRIKPKPSKLILPKKPSLIAIDEECDMPPGFQ